jgi:two-component sensor histidine kinase
VNLNIDMEAIIVDINLAIPLGLILNELVSNALRHAFPAGRSGSF